MSNAPDPPGWRVALEFAGTGAGPDALAPFEAALAPLGRESEAAFALAEDDAAGVTRMTAILPFRPRGPWLRARLAEAAAASGRRPASVAVDRLPDADWVRAVNRAHRPVVAPPFRIRGSHVAGPAPEGLRDVVIDAGPAFGTGAHETTRGCLAAIAGLAHPPPGAALLDLGAGSGVLAIAMALLWDRRVLAADCDPAAVAAARENAARNGAADRVEVRRSRGFANRALRRAGPYAVVVANILAGPLARMAPAIVRNLAPGGRAVLSGLLAGEEPALAAACAQAGLEVGGRVQVGAWPTLVLERVAPPAGRG